MLSIGDMLFDAFENENGRIKAMGDIVYHLQMKWKVDHPRAAIDGCPFLFVIDKAGVAHWQSVITNSNDTYPDHAVPCGYQYGNNPFVLCLVSAGDLCPMGMSICLFFFFCFVCVCVCVKKKKQEFNLTNVEHRKPKQH